MSELKLEVGKKYVNSEHDVSRCVYYNTVRRYALLVDANNRYSVYYYDPKVGYHSAVRPYVKLIKEYKEPQTLSGEFHVFKS